MRQLQREPRVLSPAVDPHSLLGISPGSSKEQIEEAYRRLVQIYHPDRYATSPVEVRLEAERRMRDVNAARDELLREAERRDAIPTALVECPSCGVAQSVPIEAIASGACLSCGSSFRSSGEAAAAEPRTPPEPERTSAPFVTPPSSRPVPTRAQVKSRTSLIVLTIVVVGLGALVVAAMNTSDTSTASASSTDSDSEEESGESDNNTDYSSTGESASSESAGYEPSQPRCSPISYLPDRRGPTEFYRPTANVAVSERLNFYRVSGCTIDRLASQMDSKGPGASWSEVEWNYTYDYDYTWYGPCTARGRAVRLTIETTAPYLEHPRNAPDWLLARWETFITELQEWNEGLRALAVEEAKAVSSAMVNVGGFRDCDDLDWAIDNAVDQVNHDFRNRSNAYDTETGYPDF